jgi:hypothetical protein
MLAGRPVVCQRRELAAAQRENYTMARLIDYPGSRYDLLDGEAEILPGIHVIPTPGHVDGHQSLVVQCEDGSLVLAGQSHDTASAWSADALAASATTLGHNQPLPLAPVWMQRLLALIRSGLSSRMTPRYGSQADCFAVRECACRSRGMHIRLALGVMG